MTLKEYLDKHSIKAIPDQRSQIGMNLAKIDNTTNRVLEDGWNVKDYDEAFLKSKEVSNIIINTLNKLS